MAGTPVPDGVQKLYYLCWPLGFCVSGLAIVALSKIFPVAGVGEVDEFDVFGTKGEPETAPIIMKEGEVAPGTNVQVLPA